MKEIIESAAKRRYVQPRLSRVLLIPQEEMLVTVSKWQGDENEDPINIHEGDYSGTGKGAKTNGRVWDDEEY